MRFRVASWKILLGCRFFFRLWVWVISCFWWSLLVEVSWILRIPLLVCHGRHCLDQADSVAIQKERAAGFEGYSECQWGSEKNGLIAGRVLVFWLCPLRVDWQRVKLYTVFFALEVVGHNKITGTTTSFDFARSLYDLDLKRSCLSDRRRTAVFFSVLLSRGFQLFFRQSSALFFMVLYWGGICVVVVICRLWLCLRLLIFLVLFWWNFGSLIDCVMLWTVLFPFSISPIRVMLISFFSALALSSFSIGDSMWYFSFRSSSFW